jgi:hypothetical protein
MKLFRLPEWLRELSENLLGGEDKPASRRAASPRSKLQLERLETRLAPSSLLGHHHHEHHDHHDH